MIEPPAPGERDDAHPDEPVVDYIADLDADDEATDEVMGGCTMWGSAPHRPV